VLSSSKRQQSRGIPFEPKKTKTLGAREMSIASGVIEIPTDLQLGGKTDYIEKKIMYEKF
jgi:hypothetical protein